MNEYDKQINSKEYEIDVKEFYREAKRKRYNTQASHCYNHITSTASTNKLEEDQKPENRTTLVINLTDKTSSNFHTNAQNLNPSSSISPEKFSLSTKIK